MTRQGRNQERKIVTLQYERIIPTNSKQATLFRFEGGEEEWFPDSVTDIDKGDNTVQVPEDLAIEKELEDYVVEIIPW